MRLIAFISVLVLAGLVGDTARADPYRWCAISGAGCGGNNCYFTTIEQCRAQISGMGGSCQPNPFYDGRPIATSATVQRLRKHL